MWNTIMNPLSRNIVYAGMLITLSLLVVSAGCVGSSQKSIPQINTTETPASTCSSDAPVCTVDLTGALRIDASPRVYSPLMSSTVGIGLTPNVSGLKSTETEFEWTATYGRFLDWSAPNYTVNALPEPVVNHGEKIYWSFTEPPESLQVPVIIMVTERDIASKKPLSSSRLILGWKDNMTVVVEKIE
jgi:hypothetical protein